MKSIGWVGIIHVSTIIVWIIVHIIFGNLHPVAINEHQALVEIGIEYYSNFPGYLGFDHGSKALIMILSMMIPIGLFFHVKRIKDFSLPNLTALITGCLGFAFYGLSLMLQAVTVEYAFHLYRSSASETAQSFALHLYEWSMLEGGLSVSIYIIANLLLASWIIIHSIGLFQLGHHKKLARFGIFIGVLHTVCYLISWFFLMQGVQNMHDISEAVGLLVTLWILLISIHMIRGKII